MEQKLAKVSWGVHAWCGLFKEAAEITYFENRRHIFRAL